MKEKKLPQIIILGVVAALCLGYIVYRLAGTDTQAAAPPVVPRMAPRSVQPQPTSPDRPVVATIASADPVTQRTGVEMASNVSKRDPFTPAFAAQRVSGPTRVATGPQAAGRISTEMLPPFRPSIAMDLQPIPAGFGAGAEVGPAGYGDDFPELRLTGVVRGATSIAIIRGGENERHIVREGQTINGRYKVLAINDTSVVIAGLTGPDPNSRSVKELKLGGNTNVL